MRSSRPPGRRPVAGPASGVASGLVPALVLALTLLSRLAAAHQSSVVYGDVSVEGRQVACALQIASTDLYEALGLDRDRAATREEALAGKERIAAYVAARVSVTNHGQPCPARAEGSAIVDRTDGFFFVQEVRYTCARTLEDGKLSYDLFFDIDPRHQGLLHVRAFGAETEQVLRSGSRTLSLGRALGPLDNARDYLQLGIEHIFTGYDHLAFLFCLLIIAGGLPPRRPQERPGLAGLRYVVKVVTAFTLAHSITLLCSALGWVQLPSQPVEAFIALSIGYVAAENALRPAPRHRFLLTFAFGLVHGFGFASVLKEIGLPRSGLLLSLLSFNLGVELGQLLVVAMAFPLLHLLSQLGPVEQRSEAGRRAPRGPRALELGAVAVLAALCLLVFSRFELPWPQLVAVVLVAPALLLFAVPRVGYDRAVRVYGSAVIFALSLLWLAERLSGRTLLGGALG